MLSFRINLINTLILLFPIFHSVLTAYQPKKCTQLNFLPMPNQIQCNISNHEHKKINPCAIHYTIIGNTKNTDYNHFIQLIQHQQSKTFNCHSYYIGIATSTQNKYRMIGFEYFVSIEVTNPKLQSAFSVDEEKYELNIDKNGTKITAPTYVGFVRGMETLMQSIECKMNFKDCLIRGIPIMISDEPKYNWRGLMVDTSRHYIPVKLIYETIDALMYNKMNILHWHIIDEDSFPLKLNSHPEMAQYGAFSQQEVYNTDEIKNIIQYAMVRGIRVVPELDTPGHALSWAKAPQHKDKACVLESIIKRNPKGGYRGPLDVTLSSTYTLMKQIFEQIFELFPDPIVHLGGDQVQLSCFSNLTEFTKKQNVNKSDLQTHYRKKQRQILKQMNPNKTFIYWAQKQISVEDDDIVQWWGGTVQKSKFFKKNKMIYSLYGQFSFYIDRGVGNYLGKKYGSYSTWLDIYGNLGAGVQIDSQNILGMELTLWTQLSNQYTHHTKVWIRGSSLAEKTWTHLDLPAKPNFFRRIVAHQKLMNRRGIPTAPATSQSCELNPQYCFWMQDNEKMLKKMNMKEMNDK